MASALVSLEREMSQAPFSCAEGAAPEPSPPQPHPRAFLYPGGRLRFRPHVLKVACPSSSVCRAHRGLPRSRPSTARADRWPQSVLHTHSSIPNVPSFPACPPAKVRLPSPSPGVLAPPACCQRVCASHMVFSAPALVRSTL